MKLNLAVRGMSHEASATLALVVVITFSPSTRAQLAHMQR
jgi:hypothetical protein